MANDNRRRPPHGHDPEQARREATKAREARRKHSGSASRNSRSRSTGTRRNDISKKSRYYQVRRQKMFLAAGGILIILILVIIFSARACISSRKAAEAAALQKAQEEGKELFILEAALLTEPVYREMLDEIWYIHVPQEIRMERLRSSRGYSDEKMYAVFANQPSEETFTAVSDLVIENGGTFEETEKQIDLALGRG